MVDIKNLLDLQFTIFALVAAGYILTKLGILSVESRKSLTDLVINFILPCNIIVSFLIDFNSRILMDCLAVFCVSVGIQLFAAFAGKYFYPHADERERAVFRYGTIASNATFLGYPVVMGLYGSRGLLYASIYLIPQRIVTWSAGVSCFTDAKGKSAFGSILTHPCIVSVGIGLVLMVTQVQLPAALLKTLGYASDCNTALSMLIIGNILAEVKFREIVSKKNLWFCTVRLLVFPGLVYVCCRLLGLDGLVTGVSTVLAGMPAAATTAILAAKYDGDSKLAVKVVSLSTLLSLFTLPLFCLLMAAG